VTDRRKGSHNIRQENTPGNLFEGVPVQGTVNVIKIHGRAFQKPSLGGMHDQARRRNERKHARASKDPDDEILDTNRSCLISPDNYPLTRLTPFTFGDESELRKLKGRRGTAPRGAEVPNTTIQDRTRGEKGFLIAFTRDPIRAHGGPTSTKDSVLNLLQPRLGDVRERDGILTKEGPALRRVRGERFKLVTPELKGMFEKGRRIKEKFFRDRVDQATEPETPAREDTINSIRQGVAAGSEGRQLLHPTSGGLIMLVLFLTDAGRLRRNILKEEVGNILDESRPVHIERADLITEVDQRSHNFTQPGVAGPEAENDKQGGDMAFEDGTGTRGRAEVVRADRENPLRQVREKRHSQSQPISRSLSLTSHR
jgi:hypothetical protein